MGKALELLLDSKQALNSGLLIEIKIWKVERSNKYPEGIKYRLVLVNPLKKMVLLLFDNHFPKGPHIHNCEGQEVEYHYESMQKLIEDFYHSFQKVESENENNEN
jgi:hypothetical protein